VKNTDKKYTKRNTKKSIIISVIALLIYFSVVLLLPTSNSTANSNDSNSGSIDKKIEYFTDFDTFEEWKPADDIYDLSGNKINCSGNSSCLIFEATGETNSGSNAISFQFRNFTGEGALWIKRRIPLENYKKYDLTIDFFNKLVIDPQNSVQITLTINPIIYIGTENPEEFNTDNEFIELSDDFSKSWENIIFTTTHEQGKSEHLWLGVGLSVNAIPTDSVVTTPAFGLNFTLYVDDLKITIEEYDLETGELLIIYLKSSLMFIIGGILIFLAIYKKYEPLLLLPIGTGIILANIPFVGMMEPGGILYIIYEGGIKTGIFPLLIFLGIGAMTDFGPMLANPKTSLLGAAAQFGIFTTLFGALILGFSVSESASIGIIGGADGPTAIYLSIHLAPHLLGPIAIAAYSYMALVPIIQPPIIHALTTEKERRVKMQQMRYVSFRERILFPIGVIIICAFILPAATPLIGMLMFGNLLRESGVVQRLADAASNELINIVTIFLGISVGATMIADSFLTFETIAIIILGLLAFAVGTATGVIFGKIMHRFSGGKINPMIGAAGVSAVPMAARVVQKEGVKVDPTNHLLMHAMGPNVAGVIGSAVVAGVLLTLVGG
jgi:oxaloacetate decarboxylase beta subunit